MAKKAPQIYKTNALIEASYRLSVAEQRILLAAIGQVRRDQHVTDQVMYRINARDIAEISDTSTKQAYRELEKAAHRIASREVWLSYTPEGQKEPRVRMTRWVQTVDYYKAEGFVELRFGHDILPYLANFEGSFTRYALSDVARMTSAHGIRLYELLVERLDFGNRTIEIDWLRHALQLGDKYPSIKDLKKRVIDVAVDQINEYSPLHVEYTQSKTGRRVTHLHFKFQARSLPKKRKEVNEQQQAAKTGADRDPKGRTYGIKNTEVLAAQKDGETFDDAAYRLMFERRQKALF